MMSYIPNHIPKSDAVRCGPMGSDVVMYDWIYWVTGFQRHSMNSATISDAVLCHQRGNCFSVSPIRCPECCCHQSMYRIGMVTWEVLWRMLWMHICSLKHCEKIWTMLDYKFERVLRGCTHVVVGTIDIFCGIHFQAVVSYGLVCDSSSIRFSLLNSHLHDEYEPNTVWIISYRLTSVMRAYSSVCFRLLETIDLFHTCVQ
jgi:hypothetical protein